MKCGEVDEQGEHFIKNKKQEEPEPLKTWSKKGDRFNKSGHVNC